MATSKEQIVGPIVGVVMGVLMFGALLSSCSRKVVTTEVFVHSDATKIQAPKTIVFTQFSVDPTTQIVDYKVTHYPPEDNLNYGELRCIAYDKDHNAVGHFMQNWNSEGRMPDYVWGNFKVDGNFDTMTCNVKYK